MNKRGRNLEAGSAPDLTYHAYMITIETILKIQQAQIIDLGGLQADLLGRSGGADAPQLNLYVYMFFGPLSYSGWDDSQKQNDIVLLLSQSS